MPSALCLVTNGRAAAPPAMVCIIGVSTSMKRARLEEAADFADDFAAEQKHLAGLLVDDEIDVALAVALLGVSRSLRDPSRAGTSCGRRRAPRWD
jgi:thiamine monophosphate synthase